MSPGQIKAVKVALDRVRKLHASDVDKVYKAKLSVAEGTKMNNDFLNQTTRDIFNTLPGPLRSDQIKRLKQILHQEKGSALLHDPDIREIMNISDEQLSQIKQIEDGLRKALVENIQAGRISRADGQRYDQLLIKLVQPEVKESLTSQQRKILKDLLGARLIR
jgi:hypothetical protein